MPDPLTAAEAELLAGTLSFPAAYTSARAPRTPPGDLIHGVSPLTAEDLAAAQAYMESGARLQPSADYQPPLAQIRNTHHRLAQLLAIGTDETIAAKLCNYSVSRVSILKADPAFRELLSHYESERDDQWADFVSVAANLSLDFLQHLQEQLDTTPEKFTPALAMDAIKLLADRTGHAPVQKSVQLNVNVDMASRLRAAQARLKSIGT